MDLALVTNWIQHRKKWKKTVIMAYQISLLKQKQSADFFPQIFLNTQIIEGLQQRILSLDEIRCPSDSNHGLKI